jgi:HEAT repeat protein
MNLSHFAEDAIQQLRSRGKPMDRWFAGVVLIGARTGLEEIAEVLKGAEHEILKYNLIRSLERWVAEDTCNLLIDLAKDSEASINLRVAALETIQNQRLSSALPQLLAIFQRREVDFEKRRRIRVATIKAIGHTGGEDAVDHLMEYWNSNRDYLTRDAIEEALYVSSGGKVDRIVLKSTAVSSEN